MSENIFQHKETPKNQTSCSLAVIDFYSNCMSHDSTYRYRHHLIHLPGIFVVAGRGVGVEVPVTHANIVFNI